MSKANDPILDLVAAMERAKQAGKTDFEVQQDRVRREGIKKLKQIFIEACGHADGLSVEDCIFTLAETFGGAVAMHTSKTINQRGALFLACVAVAGIEFRHVIDSLKNKEGE